MNILSLLAIGIVGWCVGGILNYLADVLPMYRKFAHPKCKKCGENLNPLFYLIGRPCEHCRQGPTLRYWFVQLCSVATYLLVWIYPPAKLGFELSILLFTYFGLIAIIDIEHRLILNPTSIAGLLLLLPVGVIWNGWLNTLIGGVAGFGIMLAIYGLGILFNRFVGKLRGETIDEEALGFGDVNLSGILGFLLGWPKIGIGLFFAIMIAGIISGLILLGRVISKSYRAFVPIPYAPFLLVSAVLMIYLYR